MTKVNKNFTPANLLGEAKSNNLSKRDRELIVFHQLMQKHNFSMLDDTQRGLARKWAKEIVV